jgi:transcriptional regulator with XRE-family HTH domain
LASSTFGERVLKARLFKAARLGRPLSQQEVANAMGVTNVTVGRWEADLKEPSLETIARLAQVLDVEVAWLAFGVGDSRVGESSHTEAVREQAKAPNYKRIAAQNGARSSGA